MLLSGRKILLGVCGGIAAYKACELARMMMKEGADVQAVLTPNAVRFVSPLTFTALTGNEALCDEFMDNGNPTEGDVYAHLDLSRDVDCFVVAPATANTLAKMAGGLADNLLCGAYLSNISPLVIAPAMNVRMWEHPATLINIDQLAIRGATIVQPGIGELACGDQGAGRLAPLEEIFAAVVENATSTVPVTVLDSQQTLKGKRFIVTAGGTREYLDPVRFITNSSSGRLGAEVVRSLLDRGAEVELVDTGIELPKDTAELITGRHQVNTAFDMLSILADKMPKADGLIMLAAIADYTPAKYESSKRSKDGVGWTIDMIETTDVLATVARTSRPEQVLAGVSLEDQDWINGGMKKAAAKNVSIMLAVELGADLPFGDNKMQCALVNRDSVLVEAGRRTKHEAAEILAGWLEQQ